MKKNKLVFYLTLLFPLIAISCGGGGGSSGPTVKSTNATGKVYTTDAITVTFSTTMNESSVEAAMQITGSDPVPGTFSWSDKTVTFTPSSLWKTHHPYTLTIATTAKDAHGNNFEETFTQEFTPELNMHDMNNDGYDDFMLGAPQSHRGGSDGGQAYLFLGKSTWVNVDLATQSASATYFIDGAVDFHFGSDTKIVGDVNGDGFADMAISAPLAEIGGVHRKGIVIIIFGTEDPKSITFTLATISDVDGLLIGLVEDSQLGLSILPAGDVNQDGLADFIVSSKLPPNDSRFWLILGRTSGFPDPSTYPPVNEVATSFYSVTGDLPLPGLPGTACDINNDEYDDMVFGSPEANGGGTMRGQAYVIAGSKTPLSRDLRTADADETLTGANNNDRLGAAVTCGDVNGDGYGDIIATAPYFNSSAGRAYLQLGSSSFADHNYSTQAASATYTGAPLADIFGLGTCICVQGDVNNDGFNDFIIGESLQKVGGYARRGAVYIFFGSAEPKSVNLATESADVTYLGTIPAPPTDITAFGYCAKVGDVNKDGIEDILVGAPLANGSGTARGQGYLVFGASSLPDLDFETDNPNARITGAANEDLLVVTPFGGI